MLNSLHFLLLHCVVIASLTSVSVAQVFAQGAPAKTGNLRITFKYRGAVPKAKNVLGQPDERLIVNPINNGLKNVVVYAYTRRRGGMQLPPQPHPGKNVNVSIVNDRYEPHVVLAQTGDALSFFNRDPHGHHVHGLFLANAPFNVSLPSRSKGTIVITEAEPTVASLQDNIYPWMKGYLLAVDHPFAGVSDANGIVEIEDLPTGRVVLRAWHEDGTFSKKIIVNGEESLWNKNLIEFNLPEGDTDYGTVEVPADQFRSNQ